MNVVVLVLAMNAALLSCGEGGITGAGGSWGEDLTNTRVSLGLYAESLEIDICNEVSVGLLANITAQQINPSMSPNILYLEGYEVAFEPINTGSPAIRGGKYMLSKVLPSTGHSFFFVDPGLKSAFLNDINSGKYPDMPDFPSYLAEYTVYGTDSFNNTPKVWGSRARLSFKIGRYSTCVPYIVPVAVTRTGKNNPDGDISDDIDFTIIGGIAPYSVISNSPLIDSLGNLGVGNVKFVIDPQQPISTTIVTLTVMDSTNQKAVAYVTLNP